MGPDRAGSAVARGAVAILGAVDAAEPGLIRASAAGVLETAPVEPAGPRTVAPKGAVEQLVKCVTGGAEALDGPVVLSALGVDRPADPPLGGRAYSGGPLDGSAAPDRTEAPDGT